MIVGIDVHKHAHAAALLDERGGTIGRLSFANSPAGMHKLQLAHRPRRGRRGCRC